jgi:hypothetical protein
MIPQRAHSLLSDLHLLLAKFDSADFIDAAGFSPELAGALTILSNKTGANSPIAAQVESSAPLARKLAKRQVLPKLQKKLEISDADSILNLLLATPYAQTANSVIDLANRYGLSIAASQKDGKVRLLRRVAVAILGKPKDFRQRLLNEVLGDSSTQTQGWIGVLKGNR